MLQFTKDDTINLTVQQEISVPSGLITGFVEADFNNPTYWYYKVKWYIGSYSDYPPTGLLIFNELPNYFKVDLYNEDGTPIYTIPESAQTGYKELIDKGTYPLKQYIMSNYPELSGKLNIVFS
jgi:hypothetical protein